MKWGSFNKIIVCLILISALAQVTIPLPIGLDIPITGQSYIVLLVALLLTPVEFCICLCMYLLIGLCGLPIFADGSSGWSKITGGSGGFLYGFLFSGLLVSWSKEKTKNLNYWSILSLTFIGTLVLISFGLFHLSLLYGFKKALAYGFYPFWKGAIIKIILTTLSYIFIDKFLCQKLSKYQPS